MFKDDSLDMMEIVNIKYVAISIISIEFYSYTIHRQTALTRHHPIVLFQFIIHHSSFIIQHSTFNIQQSTINTQQSTINNQQSTNNNQH